MTSLSLYQNKKRPTTSSLHINETIRLMGPHSRQNLSTAHVTSYSVLFLESCKIHRGLPFHLPIVFSLTCYNNSSHSREPSISLSHIYILYTHTYIYIYIYSPVLSKPSFQTDQSRVGWAEFSVQEGQHGALSFHLGVEKVLILFQHFRPTC
jgi:hypothetical protein